MGILWGMIFDSVALRHAAKERHLRREGGRLAVEMADSRAGACNGDALGIAGIGDTCQTGRRA